MLKKSLPLLVLVALAACGGTSDRPTDEDEYRTTSVVAIDDTEVDAAADPIAEVEPNGQTSATELAGVGTASVGSSSITDVVLVTGQSNALGSETTFDPVLDAPVERVYAYTENGWEPASLRQVWDLGWHPFKGLGDDPHNNFAFHFGKKIAQLRGDRVVGIILVTAPGEGISHWDGDNVFFNKIRNKALLALNELPHKSGVDGILWHQGETDWSRSGSNDPDLEEFPENDYYSKKLWDLINNFRSETWFADERPFICGETARAPINDRLNALNRDSDIWTACAAGEGLETYDEARVHFTAEALRQLGENYAEVYLQMTDN